MRWLKSRWDSGSALGIGARQFEAKCKLRSKVKRKIVKEKKNRMDKADEGGYEVRCIAIRLGVGGWREACKLI